jgi:hypothetical protein
MQPQKKTRVGGVLLRAAVVCAGWGWVLAALPQVTDADVGFDWFFLLLLSGAVVGVAWAACPFAAPAGLGARGWRWAWRSVPAGVLGVVLLGATGWGFLARVWLCEGELRAYAEALQRGQADGRPRRVGLFQVWHAEGDPTEARIITVSSLFDRSGLAFRRARPDRADQRYRHLFGPWHWYRAPDPF